MNELDMAEYWFLALLKLQDDILKSQANLICLLSLDLAYSSR